MRRRVTIHQKPIALADFPADRTVNEERCLVCDCRIPAKAYIARTEDGYPVCTASCMSLVVGTTEEAQELLEQAEQLREEAEDLERDANDLEQQAEKIEAEKDSRMRLCRFTTKRQQGGGLIDV